MKQVERQTSFYRQTIMPINRVVRTSKSPMYVMCFFAIPKESLNKLDYFAQDSIGKVMARRVKLIQDFLHFGSFTVNDSS